MGEKIYIEEQELERKFGRDAHMRVPEGYFESMINEVMAKLPEQEQEQRYVKMTRWEKLKPYVYLAAMFAGIWLMMNIFGRVIKSESVSLDNPPEAIAMAVSSLPSSETFFVPDYTDNQLNQMDVVDDVSEEFTNMSDFQAAFAKADAELDSEEEMVDSELEYI